MSRQRKPVKQVAREIRKKVNGIVKQIIALRKRNYTRQEIVLAGYNPNTVNRQVREFEQQREAASHSRSNGTSTRTAGGTPAGRNTRK